MHLGKYDRYQCSAIEHLVTCPFPGLSTSSQHHKHTRSVAKLYFRYCSPFVTSYGTSIHGSFHPSSQPPKQKQPKRKEEEKPATANRLKGSVWLPYLQQKTGSQTFPFPRRPPFNQPAASSQLRSSQLLSSITLSQNHSTSRKKKKVQTRRPSNTRRCKSKSPGPSFPFLKTPLLMYAPLCCRRLHAGRGRILLSRVNSTASPTPGPSPRPLDADEKPRTSKGFACPVTYAA